MNRADRLNTRNYSYSQSLRYEDNINLKDLRGKVIIKKLNKEPSKFNDALEPIKSLYQLLS